VVTSDGWNRPVNAAITSTTDSVDGRSILQHEAKLDEPIDMASMSPKV